MTKVVKGAGRNRYAATKARNDQRGELPPRGSHVYTTFEHTVELMHAAHNCHAYGAHDHAADGSPVPLGKGVKWCARCGHTRAAHFSGEDCVKCDECPAFVSLAALWLEKITTGGESIVVARESLEAYPDDLTEFEELLKESSGGGSATAGSRVEF
jgi:hypothetical protein